MAKFQKPTNLLIKHCKIIFLALDPDQVRGAVQEVIEELGAATIKDMGRVMAALKERYAGRMEFGKASALGKKPETWGKVFRPPRPVPELRPGAP